MDEIKLPIKQKGLPKHLQHNKVKRQNSKRYLDKLNIESKKLFTKKNYIK